MRLPLYPLPSSKPARILTTYVSRSLLVSAVAMTLAGCGAFYPMAKEEAKDGTTDPIPTAINAWDNLVSQSYQSAALREAAPRAATVVVTPRSEILSKTSMMYRMALPMTATLADGSNVAMAAGVEFKLKGKLDLSFSSVQSFKKAGDCRYDLKRSLGKCALTSSKKANAWQVDQPYTVALALIDAGSSQWQLHAKVSDSSGAEVASGASPVEALEGVTAIQFGGSVEAAILTYKDYPDCSTIPASGFQLATPTMQVGQDSQQPLKLGKAAVHGMCKAKSEGKAIKCDDDGCTLTLR